MSRKYCCPPLSLSFTLPLPAAQSCPAPEDARHVSNKPSRAGPHAAARLITTHVPLPSPDSRLRPRWPPRPWKHRPVREYLFRHIPSERRGNRIQAIIAGITSLFTQRPGDGNNVFGEKMFRIENNYVRRKEVRILVKFWRVKVLFCALCCQTGNNLKEVLLHYSPISVRSDTRMCLRQTVLSAEIAAEG